MQIEMIIAFWVILIFGVPHGVFDIVLLKQIATRLYPKQSFGLWVTLVVSYLLLVGGVVYLWWIFPFIMMVLFFLISTLHFGDYGRLKHFREWSQIMATGGLITIVLPLIHWKAVSPIVQQLVFNHIVTFEMILRLAACVWILCLCRYFKCAWKEHLDNEHCIFLLILLVVVVLPPIWSFLIYFCGYHAPRHIHTLLRKNPGLLRENKYLLIVTCGVVWLSGMTGYWFLNHHLMQYHALVPLIFVGLFALTVPHIFLVDLIGSSHLGARERK